MRSVFSIALSTIPLFSSIGAEAGGDGFRLVATLR
jgi:hypothetical protein